MNKLRMHIGTWWLCCFWHLRSLTQWLVQLPLQFQFLASVPSREQQGMGPVLESMSHTLGDQDRLSGSWVRPGLIRAALEICRVSFSFSVSFNFHEQLHLSIAHISSWAHSHPWFPIPFSDHEDAERWWGWPKSPIFLPPSWEPWTPLQEHRKSTSKKTLSAILFSISLWLCLSNQCINNKHEQKMGADTYQMRFL